MAFFALTIIGCSGDATTAETVIETPAEQVTTQPAAQPTEEQAEPAGPTPTPQVAAPAEPRKINLGVAAGRREGQTPINALIETEQVAERRFDVLRAYSFWDGEFPDLRHQWATDDERVLHLSINARRSDRSIVPWKEIATAAEGDLVHQELVQWVDRLADFDGPIRVTFHHEPDVEPEFGTAQDFVDAWRRFATLLDRSAPQIETVWVLSGFNLNKLVAEEFWPGDDLVDMIGADAFNWFGCRGTPESWRNPEQVLAPLMSFAVNHPDKPLVLAELGSDEDPDDPERKAQWLNELALLLVDDKYARIDTIVFFHNDHDAKSSCDWWLDSSEKSAAAFAQLAALPVLGGDVAAPAPDQCPIIAMAESLVEDVALVDGDGDGRYDFEFGEDNRFLGIGDQSADGADHRILLRFDALTDLPSDATLEFQIRVGEREPLLRSPVQLRVLDTFATLSQAFGQAGQILEPSLFTSGSPGGHHVVDVTGRLDPTRPSALRLQLAAPPSTRDGRIALYIGTGNANQVIDRPALIARHCG